MAPFATAANIKTRLGRDFATNEEALATFLIEGATALIAHEVDKDDEWAAALNPVPVVLTWTVIEAVRRVMSNPQGLASAQEQLGAYSHSETYPRVEEASAAGLVLTATEQLLVRKAVHGRNTTSVTVRSEVDDYTETFYGS